MANNRKKLDINEKNDDHILMEAFDLSEEEVLEAKYNLLGFFGTLQKIKWRLEKEGKL